MHSFRGFKELHLNLKIIPDLVFHCNFINPLIIFESIFGERIRLPACKALAGLHVSRHQPSVGEDVPERRMATHREKTQQRDKKSPKLVCSTSQPGSDSSKLLSSFISTSWRFGKNSTTLTGAREAHSLWGNSSKMQYYTQSWEGCFMILTSFWENISAESLQEQKQSKTKDGCSHSSRSKKISVKANSIGLLLAFWRRLSSSVTSLTDQQKSIWILLSQDCKSCLLYLKKCLSAPSTMLEENCAKHPLL